MENIDGMQIYYLVSWLLKFLIMIPLWVGIPILFYFLSMRKPNRTPLYMFLFFFLSPFGILITTILIYLKVEKMRLKVYNDTRINASNQSVDNLVAFLEKYGCPDKPNSWHQLRGVWYAANESPKITTAKKQELKTYLLTKGLYLNNEEKQIIDNFGI